MRQGGTWGVFAVLLALLGGTAAASNVAGMVLLDGPLRLTEGGHLQGPPLALFLETSRADLNSFDAAFDTVILTEYSREDIQGPLGSVTKDAPTRRTSVLHDAHLILMRGDHDGLLGIYRRGAATVDASLSGDASLLAVDEKRYADADVSATGENPGSEQYGVQVSVPHLNVANPAFVQYSGAGAMKIWGMDFEIVAREGTTRHVTGMRPDEDGLPKKSETWVFLQFADSRISIDSSAPVELALEDARISWTGGAEMHPQSGSLLVDGQERADTGDVVTLDGPVSGTATAHTGTGSARLSLTLRSVEEPPAGVSAILTGQAPRPLDVVLLLGVAIGAGSLGVWAVRRRMRGEMDPDEMLTLAHLAGEGGRHDEALGWVRRARSLAPQSGVLALEEAFHLGESGRVDEALAAYREAARLSDDGQAEFDAALLGHRSGALPDADIERLLVGALEKNPGLVLELDESLGMRLRPSASDALEAAIRRAHTRLDRP